MLIDTHTHLYAEEFNSDRNVLIEKVITIKIDLGIHELVAYYQVRKCYDIKEVFDGFKMLGLSLGDAKSEDFYVILSNEGFGAILHKDNCTVVKKW